MPLKIFSFFSGIGMLDLGFEKEGFDVVFVNEYFKPFLNSYQFSRNKMKIRPPEYGYSTQSVEEFLQTEGKSFLKRSLRAARADNSLVGFIGGPPCPDFSIGGKNRGSSGDNGKLSKVYADIIVDQKPDWFLFENVKGLWRTKRHREFFDQICGQLRAAGYDLNYRLFNAIECGVAQDRDRIILFGTRKCPAPLLCTSDLAVF